ncbi:MAG: 2-amino-4-hydroxy-6-hydroxymethyldihydropteridine diphosphokinase [Proteobacteria bacterium]|nr:2-amino-4-hydroxy-6-hydroxymethyldihydropteridine diphosphokinase [Pseudomonadota bacterium]
MPRIWLLLLGSNFDSNERVHAALAALRALGPAALVTAILRLPAHGGARVPDYYNALATLESSLDREVLVGNLKRIEHELGRVHGSGRVAIDIDLLACRDGGRWLADRHAIEKGDLGQSPVPQLLREAGIRIDA